MFLRTVMLGVILFAPQNVSADNHSTSSGRSSSAPSNACPARDGVHSSNVQSRKTVCERAANVATSAEQQLLLQQKCAELDRLQHEIMQLRASTGTAQQILIKVQMLEVSLTKLREMGTQTEWFANGYTSGPDVRRLLGAIGDRAETPSTEAAARSEANDGLQFVDWLKNNNLAKVLSEPTLVTLSGRPSSVHVGGEFPVLTKNDTETAIDFRSFGTQLELRATALGNNQIRLDVNTRVSDVDYNSAIEIDGARTPGLKVRECDAGFELASNETAVLTGLIERRTEARRDARGQIEDVSVEVGLMVVVTPELVPPSEVRTAREDRDMHRAPRK